MRKSQIVVWVFLIVAGIVAGNTVLNLSRTHEAVAANSEIYRQLDLFGEVLERVRADYVEEPDDRELIEEAINGMLSGLDPHSAYLSPKNFREMQVQTRGEFGGLGIEVTMENEVVKVVSPIDNTPAEEAGLLAGDYITHLDGDSIRGLTLSEAVEKMRGPVDSEILLTVVREGMDEPFDVRIKRDIIRITPVSYEVEGDIGYLRVKTFNEQTYDELRDAVASVQDELGDELAGYILDLRNNPGGLLDQAIAVSDAFLDQGAIVLTRGRKSSESQRASAKAGDLTDGKPIVVLINGGSASASEIVAGALKDQERAAVVGSRSFGKGSVQTIIPLGTDGAIRLTTARYYTPSGRSIQAKGVSPDYDIKQELPEEMKERLAKPRGEAALRGHLSAEDGEETSGSVAYVPKEKEKDTQLQFAIDLLHGEVPEEQEKAQNTVAPEKEAAN
jgi:carboxyl-terminal processing protease